MLSMTGQRNFAHALQVWGLIVPRPGVRISCDDIAMQLSNQFQNVDVVIFFEDITRYFLMTFLPCLVFYAPVKAKMLNNFLRV